jgi:glycosyltransferase involved in cell wall biosynthesis
MSTGMPARRVLVVIPALNEAASVAAVICRVKQVLPVATVLVVDDGSSDRTAEVASAAGATVARLPFNLGVGGAMRTGFRYALRHGFDAVVQIDADGQHDPAHLPELLNALRESDVVIGARFAGVGEYDVRGPRSWAMRVLARLLSRILRVRLTDATSGYRAANRRAIGVFARHYPAEYLGDTVESLVIARRVGLRVTQVPVAMRARTAGVPSQSVVPAVLYLGRASAALLLALVRRWPYEEEDVR